MSNPTVEPNSARDEKVQRVKPAIASAQPLAIFSDTSCLGHEMQPGHAESPARLSNTLDYLNAVGLLDEHPLIRPRPLEPSLLRLAHSQRYLDYLTEIDPATIAGAHPHTLARIDADTALNPQSLTAAKYAAGAAVDAVAELMAGNYKTAFCAVRPPGHHAEIDAGMGFCVYNSIAIAALTALEQHGLRRVAILDFDVHHGNGTVDIFKNDPRVLVCSTFQHPYYPNRHHHTEARNIVNCPLSAGSGEREFRLAIERDWAPAIEGFDPELIFVSAGFDAHIDDPLANLRLTETDFRWVTDFICAQARAASCQGRIVSLLEGGYNLDALARSVVAHLEGLKAAS